MPETAKLIHTVLKTLPAPVVLSGVEDGLVLWANERAARAFGIPLDRFIGFKTPNVYANAADREEIVEILRRDGRLTEHEVLLQGPQQTTFLALASSEPVNYEGKAALCTTFVDITDRRRVEATVRGAREFAESILATIRDPLVVLDRDFRVRSVNRSFCLSFGHTESDVVDKHIGDLSDGAWADTRLQSALASALANGEVLSDFEVEHRSTNLGTRTMLLNARRVYGLGNNTESILLSIEDITERKREREQLVSVASSAQRDAATRTEQLAETERRLGAVLQNMPGIAYRCLNDQEWTMEFLSDGCLPLTGYSPFDLVGNRECSYSELILEEDREAVWSAVQKAVKQHQRFQVEYRIRTKGGATKWVWEQGGGVYDPDTRDLVALEGIIHDVTERRSAEQEREGMEAQMRAAQRMEAVGRLAGGIAHDFNNILTVIQSYAGFLREEFREGDPAREDVDAVVEAADRAVRLTSQLLAFSRRQVQELAVVDINEVVGNLDKMLRRLIGEDIDLVTKLSSNLGKTKVDVTQVEQVLMNLAVNARDAMPRGGKLTLETAGVQLDETYGAAKNVTVPPGSYVMLAVTDTGVGMSKEIQSKIFEPFFTTKEVGKGTGLGLSTVYGIVKQSGGYIWIYSEEGRGTTFKIYLPRAEDDAASKAPRRAAPQDLRGSETIVVVEDEEPVRKVAVRVLKRYGYEVLEASHGGEALLICERHQGTIHLMLTDVVMPHLSGRELVDRTATRQPDMRVVYMSGYTDNAIVQHGVLDEGTVFLQKPFTPEALLQKVRATLDR